jgi:phosphotriesterase-related protein
MSTSQVMTVTGPLNADKMGVTLAHEHLFIDLCNQYKQTEKISSGSEPLAEEHLEKLRINPYIVKDNLILDNVDVCVDEVERFRSSGGKTIVDCTSIGINRSPLKLREVAERTGVNIIAGSGYYTYDTHPTELDDLSAEEIAERMLSDFLVGIDGTGIKAGVIGEIGTSNPVHPNEKKNLAAAGIVFKQTGAAIQVHTYPWGRTGLKVAELLFKNGVDPGKIAICHTDVMLDLNYIRSLLKMGVFVEFDNFGKEFQADGSHTFAKDSERVDAVKILIDEGFEKQLLLTNDICLKIMLHRYGGYGYDYILTDIVPAMSAKGIGEEIVNLFLRDNPRQLYGRLYA